MSNQFTMLTQNLDEASRTLMLEVGFNETFRMMLYTAQKRIEEEMARLEPTQYPSPAKFQEVYTELKMLRDCYVDILNGLVNIREYGQSVGITPAVKTEENPREESSNAH